MSDNTAGRLIDDQRRPGMAGRLRHVLTAALVALIASCIFILETRFVGLNKQMLRIGETPVTLYTPATSGPFPAVVLVHGFAGSRQMMDQTAVSVARQGFAVASVDLPGHGRNAVRLSPDITRIEGTTAQLVRTIDEVAAAVIARPDITGPVSFIGHSMATDVVIRAAELREDVGAVVAISMYSPAVTSDHPKALLVLSGATEGHLRAAGLDTLRLLDPDASEGETVTRDGMSRRVAVAPYVGHVGVLYAAQSLSEVTGWLREVTGVGTQAALDLSGWIAGLLLAGLVVLAWPLARVLPRRADAYSGQVSSRTFWACVTVPIPFVLAIALAPAFGVAGYAAFGSLSLTLAVWGGIQLVILYSAGCRIPRLDVVGTFGFLTLSLMFALALDRYGAAFLPAGSRAVIAAGLVVGTLPAMVADTLLVFRASALRRLVARVALLGTLAAAMAMASATLGLTFTVIPVLILYFVVYGSIARWIAARRGPAAVAVGKGVVLAWAIAASTPLFVA